MAACTFYAGQGLDRNYARADFDRTLNFIQSYIYELPFGKGKHFLSRTAVAGKIVGGWQVSGILSMRTGTPLTFTGSNSSEPRQRRHRDARSDCSGPCPGRDQRRQSLVRHRQLRQGRHQRPGQHRPRDLERTELVRAERRALAMA